MRLSTSCTNKNVTCPLQLETHVSVLLVVTPNATCTQVYKVRELLHRKTKTLQAQINLWACSPLSVTCHEESQHFTQIKI